ncbi:cupin domain-containing protein [Symbioplanes lichenis]|uniref:cupin domain-containing protein n=1 Tax=Symbioplanes lichenis TaxID=1629072 RepID=UPI00273958EF|nr:cupin domain-containing protein [Actinoplanes lichenis]
MSVKLHARRAGVVAVAVTAGLLAAGGAARATPAGPGVAGTIIWEKTVANTHYVFREITIPAGQATGWHYHDGTLYGYVKQGTLSHFDSTCESDGVYPAHHTIQEPSGADHVHIGMNKGTVPVILDVLYVLPAGAPLSEDAPNPGCDFQ